MVVCICGRESADHARYCYDCGRQLTTDSGDGPGALEFESGTVSTVRAEVTSGGPGRARTALYAVIAAVVVLGIGYVLVSPTAEPRSDDGAEAAADDAGQVDDGAEAAADGAGQADDGGDAALDAAADEPAAAEPASAEPEPEAQGEPEAVSGHPVHGHTSTGLLADGSEAASPQPFDPILSEGEVALYQLVVGTEDGLVVFDLNKAVRRHIGSVAQLEPLGSTDDELLVFRNERVFVLPLDDLSATPQPLGQPSELFFGSGLSAITDDLAWFCVWNDGQDPPVVFTAFDIETGEPVDHPLGELIDCFTDQAVVHVEAQSGLFTAASGGVYEATVAGSEQVAPGHLVAADAERLLIMDCDKTYRCSNSWIDRATGVVLDLSVPPTPVEHGRFVTRDWLRYRSGSPYLDAPSTLLNVETGQLFEVPSRALNGFSNEVTVSPDGRWIAMRAANDRSIELMNLFTRNSFVLPVGERPEFGMVFTRISSS